MSVARQMLNVFSLIIDEGAYSNLALKQELKNTNDERDKRFISAVIYTSLEHLLHIDYVINNFCSGKHKKVIRNILRLGVCQVLFMNRPDSAVCNECVKLTKEIGKGAFSGYVNGVLRNICRAKEQNDLPKLPLQADRKISILTGYPLWFVSEYIDRFGESDTLRILQATDDTVSIRPQYPFTAEELESLLEKNNISFEKGNYISDIYKIKGFADITQSELFCNGKITIQSEGSAIVCKVCDAKPNAAFLDACAAPGGKSAYIASLTHNECNITACELHEHRTELMKNTFSRLNVSCADAITNNAALINNSFCDKFDIVLCDVPCSGLGVIGKPDVRYHKEADYVNTISKLQYEILNTCSKYVKKGGSIVYSTCTVSRRENEDIINKFLNGNEEFALDTDVSRILPHSLKERSEKGYFYLLPGIDKTEGFFIAKMKRIK